MELFSFAMGPVPMVCHFEISQQRRIIEDFFMTDIMPVLFPGTPPDAFAFKSIDQGIDQIYPGSGLLYSIFDVVIAVQD